MSKLKELIAELCPNGVEYKALEKCCVILDKKENQSQNQQEQMASIHTMVLMEFKITLTIIYLMELIFLSEKMVV